jgi:hypothetical protein
MHRVEMIPPANPWHEKSNVEPRNTSGGWSSWEVTLPGAHMFCSTCIQRYGSASGERL